MSGSIVREDPTLVAPIVGVCPKLAGKLNRKGAGQGEAGSKGADSAAWGQIALQLSQDCRRAYPGSFGVHDLKGEMRENIKNILKR